MAKKGEFISGVTKTGFSYSIAKNQLDNYELFEAIAEVEDDPTCFPKVMSLLLGKNQTKELKEHLRREDGTISIEKMMNEVTDIFQSNQQTKNS